MQTKVKLFRDENRIVWIFEPVAGVEKFGTVTKNAVRVDGYHAGLIAQDWLKDNGYEPVRAN